MLAKTVGILKLVDEIEFHPLNYEKVIFTQILFSDYNSDFNSYLVNWNRAKWNKKGTRNEFESLDTQKIDFYVLEK